MGNVKYKCSNSQKTINCSLSGSGKIFELPADKNARCPECGSELLLCKAENILPTPVNTPSKNLNKTLVIGGLVIVVAIIIGTVIVIKPTNATTTTTTIPVTSDEQPNVARIPDNNHEGDNKEDSREIKADLPVRKRVATDDVIKLLENKLNAFHLKGNTSHADLEDLMTAILQVSQANATVEVLGEESGQIVNRESLKDYLFKLKSSKKVTIKLVDKEIEDGMIKKIQVYETNSI